MKKRLATMMAAGLLACAAMCLKLFEKRPAMKVYIYIGCGFLWLRAAWLICEGLFL